MLCVVFGVLQRVDYPVSDLCVWLPEYESGNVQCHRTGVISSVAGNFSSV